MPIVKLPTVYLDLANETDDVALTGSFVLFNRLPEPDETDVPTNAAIEIMAADVAVAGLNSGTITVTSAAGTVVAWTSGGGFHANYAASAYNTSSSPGAGGADIHRWQLVRNTAWASHERINVRVQLTPLAGSPIDVAYWFTVEDVTQPGIASASTRGLKILRVTFNEPVLMSTDTNGALRVREVSGRIAFTAPATVEIEDQKIAAANVGDFLCFTGSGRALNNDYFKINTVVVDDPGTAAVEPVVITTAEQQIQTEAPLLTTRGFITPYRLIPVMEKERVIPTYTPCIVGARRIDERTIELDLDQALSPGRPYQIQAINIGDDEDPVNVTPNVSAFFVAEQCAIRPGRNFSLWDHAIPQINKKEDVSRDLERFVRCIDDVVKLLLDDIDKYEEMLDFDLARPEFVEALLVHLGNPYTFLNDELQKRRVLSGLVRTYKDAGTDRAIENAILDLTGVQASVFPMHAPDVSWVLGDSELGVESILGTGTNTLRYSFEIVIYEAVRTVGNGSTTTTVNFATGGLVPNAHIGRHIRVANQDRIITSNTANSATVSVAFSGAPIAGSTATILGVLTEDQRRIIKEIANTWKTAHTHFVRFIESGTIVPTY